MSNASSLPPAIQDALKPAFAPACADCGMAPAEPEGCVTCPVCRAERLAMTRDPQRYDVAWSR